MMLQDNRSPFRNLRQQGIFQNHVIIQINRDPVLDQNDDEFIPLTKGLSALILGVTPARISGGVESL